MKLESNYDSSGQRSVLFLFFFAFFVKKFAFQFFLSKNSPERMSESSQTYLFNSNYNTDPSTMVIRHFKNMRFFR